MSGLPEDGAGAWLVAQEEGTRSVAPARMLAWLVTLLLAVCRQSVVIPHLAAMVLKVSPVTTRYLPVAGGQPGRPPSISKRIKIK